VQPRPGAGGSLPWQLLTTERMRAPPGGSRELHGRPLLAPATCTRHKRHEGSPPLPPEGTPTWRLPGRWAAGARQVRCRCWSWSTLADRAAAAKLACISLWATAPVAGCQLQLRRKRAVLSRWHGGRGWLHRHSASGYAFKRTPLYVINRAGWVRQSYAGTSSPVGTAARRACVLKECSCFGHAVVSSGHACTGRAGVPGASLIARCRQSLPQRSRRVSLDVRAAPHACASTRAARVLLGAFRRFRRFSCSGAMATAAGKRSRPPTTARHSTRCGDATSSVHAFGVCLNARGAHHNRVGRTTSRELAWCADQAAGCELTMSARGTDMASRHTAHLRSLHAYGHRGLGCRRQKWIHIHMHAVHSAPTNAWPL